MTVNTDSSLQAPGGDGKLSLREDIQKEVTLHFKGSARDTDDDASKFYTQYGFEILHESDGQMDYTTTTANADGKTTVYVYFTRNIYTLQFHYYGQVDGKTKIATNTNGYSHGGGNAILNADGSLNFGYSIGGTVPGDGTWWKNEWETVTDTSVANMPVPQTITIRAKYGADLREVWPAARAEERLTAIDTENTTRNPQMVSWATTAGKYRDEAVTPGSTHFYEATLMGLYAAMDAYIIADSADTAKTHHLVAYWSGKFDVSYYRYTHCFQLPGLVLNPDDSSVVIVKLYGDDTTDLRNVLYLVPTGNQDIAKYGFDDLMEVAYDEVTGTVTYGEKGGYYAVRGYETGSEVGYYAVGRQVDTTSTNNIGQQNPSARAHMERVNDKADHTTECQDGWGQTWAGQGNEAHQVGTPGDPYDLYFYYNRMPYTIYYMAANTREDIPERETELGRIVLPYGAHVTEEKYAFQLDYTDTNQATKEDDTAKYLWTYPTESDGKTPLPAVSVCPDRNPDGPVEWKFKGWGLGPAGVNMLWTADNDADPGEPQAQIDGDFYIGSDLLLYAIWERPMLTVTYHLNGGEVGKASANIVAYVPANSKITDVGAEIPRPVRSGFTMKGWFESDEEGMATETPFDFDKVIIKDQHVAAVWTAASVEEYDYTVYYVTETLREEDASGDFETIYINQAGEIVTDGSGTLCYVLEKDQQVDQPYAPGTVLNLTAKPQSGYIAQETNKSLALDDSTKDYNAVFFYKPQATGSYTVNFVEAGTEGKPVPTAVYTLQTEADQTVVTPNAGAVRELTGKGYQLVNKKDDGTYEAVTDYQALTWLDAQGQSHAMSALTVGSVPAVIAYLVQPIDYTITYQIAAGSPAEAAGTLAAVENPTKYTVKDTFTLENPGRISADGGWYEFSHWSLGEHTTEPGAAGQKEYPTLTVDPGTTGHLIFVANWKKIDPAPVGGLTVSKTVAGSGAETGREFHFTVTLDAPISGQFGGMTFTDGSARFTLKHGQSVTAEGLLAGIRYTVTEEAVSGYTTTSSGASGTIQKDKTLAAAFTNTKRSKPDPDDGDDDDDDPKLNTDDHYSYIIGYKDGTVRPYGTITRGEVATIFFRLLTDKARDKYWSQTNGYSDCGPDLWCNNAISTLTNMGIIDGFKDGTFQPYGRITRAQFAKIAVGFFETTREEYGGYFSDVEPDAWYTDYVEAASRVGLVQGFEDGTFRPNANITRAQSCVIVNRALGRKPDEDHLLPERKMITWPDNNPGDWYYADMQEATNSHDYKWLAKGKDKKYMEEWTKKLEQRDWAAFEHAWSTAHSAPGGEVVK